MLELFGEETAKKPELLSTILYFADIYERMGPARYDIDIIKSVQEVKPHFDEREISANFEALGRFNKEHLFDRDFTALGGS